MLISDNPEAAQRQLARFEAASAQVGLRLNVNKTEVMYVGDTNLQQHLIQTSDGNILRVCDDFCYLGCNIADSKTAFQKRRQLAWIAARRLSVVWDSNASESAKIDLFKACIESVLFYSGESLTLTTTLSSQVDASHRALLRYAIGVRYPQRISTHELYARTCVPPATTTLRK